MLLNDIEKTIRKFNYDNYGIHIGDVTKKQHEWPQNLAAEIVKLVSAEIDKAIVNGLTAAL